MQRKSMRTATLVTAAVMSLVAMRAADCAVVISLQEEGSDVVATASGSANLTGLTFMSSTTFPPGMNPSYPAILVGSTGGVDAYGGLLSEPDSFGSGDGNDEPSDSSGALVGGLDDILCVPADYVSGAPLSSSTTTWENHTLSSLGVTPGTYVWSWGTGDNADTFTLYAGTTPPPTGTVPTLSEWGMIALALLLGAAAVSTQARQRRKLAVRT